MIAGQDDGASSVIESAISPNHRQAQAMQPNEVAAKEELK